MRGLAAMAALERVVYRGERFAIGAFRCPIGHPEFRHAGPIGDRSVFVFPRSRVWIRHKGHHAFPTDVGLATLYNPGQPYTREPLGPEGDFCDWFAVDAATVLDEVRVLDPPAENPRRAFRFTHGPTDAATYLTQRRLFEVVSRGMAVEALEAEEVVLTLLRRVLSLAYRAWHRGFSPPLEVDDRDTEDAVRRARLILAARFADPLSLSDVARAVGMSHPRLSRAFRRVTGTTLHDYRAQLRLRTALAALADRNVDLTELALDLGYSSHSHFTHRFRAVFGVTPSLVRGRMAAADLGALLPPLSA